jgi:hypothetical protein
MGEATLSRSQTSTPHIRSDYVHKRRLVRTDHYRVYIAVQAYRIVSKALPRAVCIVQAGHRSPADP